MRLGLVNSLSSSLFLAGGDQLALDLQFAADKTLTARKGPTPVLTRGSTGTFVGSDGLIQSAGNNVARFDHNPVTLASRGLLIEEGRTNLSLHSGALVINTGWAGSVTSSVSGTGPDGNSSYQISESTPPAIQSIANTGGTGIIQITPVVSGTTYTGSIFVKKVAGSIDWMQLTFGSTGFGSTQYANFNIGTGTVGNSAGLASGTVPRIEAYGDGWYRLSIVATATATVATNNVIIGFIQNTNGTARLPSYSGSTSNRFLASLCQFEAGSFPTSYIPTTTSALARSADVCSISGADFTGMYNQPEGTLFGSGIVDTVGVGLLFPTFLGLSDGTANNKIVLGSTNSGTAAVRPIIVNSGSTIYNQSVGTVSAGQSRKVALAYKSSDYRAAANSQLATAGTTGSPPSGLNRADIHSNFFVGTIASIRYYKKRLPNAKLVTLTT